MKNLLFILISLHTLSCTIIKTKDVSYITNKNVLNMYKDTVPLLNVFAPKNLKKAKRPILIFVHGGYWEHGNKDIYNFFGRRLSRKGIATIIPSYTLSPRVTYNTMTHQIAEAIRWTKLHAHEFNGDTTKIFLTGHSAGGHLAALAVMNPKYGINSKSIAGIILNDAAGLDMLSYLNNNPPTKEHNSIATWTKDPKKWKDASPIYFLNKNTPPLSIYVGKKTYPRILKYNEVFLNELKKYQPNVEIKYLNKKHVPMMVQFIYPWNKRAKEFKAIMIDQ